MFTEQYLVILLPPPGGDVQGEMETILGFEQAAFCHLLSIVSRKWKFEQCVEKVKVVKQNKRSIEQ